MEGQERRSAILELLSNENNAISGMELAKRMGVSRQVIVQDIALLRAVNRNILSTTKGYMLYQQEKQKEIRCFMVKHTTDEIEDELCTIVDFGGKVLDVIVTHEIYGQITKDLLISTRQDVYEFVEKVKNQNIMPLKELTAGLHFHTVEADTQEILDRIQQALEAKNYLQKG